MFSTYPIMFSHPMRCHQNTPSIFSCSAPSFTFYNPLWSHKSKSWSSSALEDINTEVYKEGAVSRFCIFFYFNQHKLHVECGWKLLCCKSTSFFKVIAQTVARPAQSALYRWKHRRSGTLSVQPRQAAYRKAYRIAMGWINTVSTVTIHCSKM